MPSSLSPAIPHFECRILVAEDNAINQTVAVRLLERLGCRVDVVTNGEEVVDACLRQTYDLILMDCQMPKVDGFEAARRIRQLAGPERFIPIVALTASAVGGEQEQCRRAGMDDYLSKPVRLDQLAAALARRLPVSKA